MALSQQDQADVRREFQRLTNLTQAELTAWLDSDESRQVGMIRPGESESVGRQSGRRILAIRAKRVAELDAADYAHMKKVIGYCRRHLAQRPWGDIMHSRWRWSLMNWGHDPIKSDL